MTAVDAPHFFCVAAKHSGFSTIWTNVFQPIRSIQDQAIIHQVSSDKYDCHHGNEHRGPD